jgi:hypothetical protein
LWVVKIVKKWINEECVRKKKDLVPKYTTVRIPVTSPAAKFATKMQE